MTEITLDQAVALHSQQAVQFVVSPNISFSFDDTQLILVDKVAREERRAARPKVVHLRDVGKPTSSATSSVKGGWFTKLCVPTHSRALRHAVAMPRLDG